MALYRFYPINAAGRVCAPGTELECASDAAAIEALPNLMEGLSGLEIWHGTRRVATVMATSATTTHPQLDGAGCDPEHAVGSDAPAAKLPPGHAEPSPVGVATA